MKIKVSPEGRDGIFIADKDSIVKFILSLKDKYVHNFVQSGNMFLGADWDKEQVIQKINHNDSIAAILTGENYKGNMCHALSVTDFKKLYMFDIGEITLDQLEVT